jgi:V/A-type H+/Na+-transporting ATPase subunit F
VLGFVIGDNNMITGFRLVGVEGVEVTSVDMARQALTEALDRNDVALILISQQFSEQMRSDIDKMRSERVTPLIVEIPGSVGPASTLKMSELVSRTLGIKI